MVSVVRKIIQSRTQHVENIFYFRLNKCRKLVCTNNWHKINNWRLMLLDKKQNGNLIKIYWFKRERAIRYSTQNPMRTNLDSGKAVSPKDTSETSCCAEILSIYTNINLSHRLHSRLEVTQGTQTKVEIMRTNNKVKSY